jgi:hypothetical protein
VCEFMFTPSSASAMLARLGLLRSLIMELPLRNDVNKVVITVRKAKSRVVMWPIVTTNNQS